MNVIQLIVRQELKAYSLAASLARLEISHLELISFFLILNFKTISNKEMGENQHQDKIASQSGKNGLSCIRLLLLEPAGIPDLQI
jgi:hypothetical protein